jgi:hypothetical protein
MAWSFKKDKNWKKFEKMLGKKSEAIIKKHIKRATLFNGKIVEKHIRETIKDNKFAPNAALTEAIKKDNKPLVGVETGAQLFKAITSQALTVDSAFKGIVFIGVLRTNNFYNVAKTIHNGKTIPVTEKMRGLFLALSLASQGKIDRSQLSERGQDLFDYMQQGWKPLKRNTTRIVIPPREFVDNAFRDKSIYKVAKKNWKQALQEAFREIKASN